MLQHERVRLRAVRELFRLVDEDRVGVRDLRQQPVGASAADDDAGLAVAREKDVWLVVATMPNPGHCQTALPHAQFGFDADIRVAVGESDAVRALHDGSTRRLLRGVARLVVQPTDLARAGCTSAMTTLDGIFMRVLPDGDPAAELAQADQCPVTGGRLLFSLDLKHSTVADVAVELELRSTLQEPRMRETDPELAVMKKPSAADPIDDLGGDPAENPAMDLLAYYRAPQNVTKAVYAFTRAQTGIFLTTGGIEVLSRYLQQAGHPLKDAIAGAAHALYLHEMFHHIVASAAAVLEAEGAGRAYEDYRERADAQYGYNPLEEGLSNAFMLRNVDPEYRQALVRFVEGQTAGYRDGVSLSSPNEFAEACVRLVRQLLIGPVGDDHAAVRALSLDVSNRLVTPATTPLNVVESPNSAHELGDWQFIG